MKYHTKKIAALLLVFIILIGPVASKTTFIQTAYTKFLALVLNVPYGQATSMGGINAFIETGHQNRLLNSNFEAPTSTFDIPSWDEGTSGWSQSTNTCLSGKCAALQTLDENNVGDLQQTVAFAAHEQGLPVVASAWVHAAVSDEEAFEFCLDDVCKQITHEGYKRYEIEGVSAANNIVKVRPVGGVYTNGTVVALRVDIASLSLTDKLPGGASQGQFLIADSAEPTGLKWSDQLQGKLNPVTDFELVDCGGSWTTNTTYTCYMKQIGDEIKVVYAIELSGAPNATNLSINLPSGYTINTDKINSPQSDANKALGTIHFDDNNSSTFVGELYLASTGALVASYLTDSSTSERIAAASESSPIVFAANDIITGEYTVPVNELSSGLDAVAKNALSPDYAGFVSFSFMSGELIGHKPADGACYKKADYPDYMKRVGTLYGECTVDVANDGFNVPDMRGYFPRVLDNMGTLAGAAGVDVDGTARTVGVLQSDENKAHKHIQGFVAGGYAGRYGKTATGLSGGAFDTYTANGGADGANTSTEGGTETRPKNMALMAYVRMVDNNVIVASLKTVAESFKTKLSPVTDWQDYPSTAVGDLITATGTNPTYGTVLNNRARYRQVGGNLEIEWDFAQTAAGTTGSGVYLISLPPNFTIDTTAKPVNTDIVATSTGLAAQATVGDGHFGFASGSTSSLADAALIPYSSTKLKVALKFTTAAGVSDYRYFGDGAYTMGSVKFWVSLKASIPVNELKSEIDAVVNKKSYPVVKAAGNAGQALTASSDIPFIETEDKTNSWSGTQFTAPESGEYTVSGMIFFGSVDVRGVEIIRSIGTNLRIAQSTSNNVHTFKGEFYLEEGETFSIRTTTGSGTLSNSNTLHHLHIQRLVTEEVIAAVIEDIEQVKTDIQNEDRYSETEQVIGTWNGDVLYQRCFTIASDITTNGTTITTWDAGLKPKEIPLYIGTAWNIHSKANNSASQYTIAYDSNDGTVKCYADGYFCGSETSMCMKYTK